MKKIKTFLILCAFSTLVACQKNSKPGVKENTVEKHKKNDKDKTFLQPLSQKEKFEKASYPLNKIEFSDGSLVDLSKSLDFERPQKTTSNYFLSKDLTYLKKEKFDNNGVLLTKGAYHPTRIAKLALKSASKFNEVKSEKSKKIFENQMEWIVNNFHQKENYGTWFFPFTFSAYNLKAGWSSGYAHSLMLSTLIEAYKITGEARYKVFIEKALKAYAVPIEYGGFKRSWNKGEWWFEEYATDKPSRVMNGFIFSLECLHNAYIDLKIPLAKRLFDEGILTLLNHLEDYDTKYSSRYNLADWKNQISKENYHEIHIIQLLWLYKVTKKEKFKIYAKRFLENDRDDFFKKSPYFNLPKKIKKFKASKTIDTIDYGVENLNNEIWAYGKFWSSYKTTNLIIDFGKYLKNIDALTLYHVTEKSKNVNFEIYRFDSNSHKWVYVEKISPKFNRDKISVYNKTGKYETFIEHFKIHEDLFGEKIKIVFKADAENIIALRNINFIFDRQEDLDDLLKLTDKRIEQRQSN